MSDAGKAEQLARAAKPRPELAKMIGGGEVARSGAVERLWAHINRNTRQDPANKQPILSHEALRRVGHGDDKVTLFEMNAHLAKTLS